MQVRTEGLSRRILEGANSSRRCQKGGQVRANSVGDRRSVQALQTQATKMATARSRERPRAILWVECVGIEYREQWTTLEGEPSVEQTDWPEIGGGVSGQEIARE